MIALPSPGFILYFLPLALDESLDASTNGNQQESLAITGEPMVELMSLKLLR